MKPMEWIDASYTRIVTRYEAFWVFVSGALTVTLLLALFGAGAFTPYIMFHFKNAWLSIPGISLFVNIFLLVNFLVFFFKNRLPQFQTSAGYWILVVSGLLSLFLLDVNIGTFNEMTEPGWKIYPPFPELVPDPFALTMLGFVGNLLRLVQFIVLVLLLLAVYRWGRRKAD